MIWEILKIIMIHLVQKEMRKMIKFCNQLLLIQSLNNYIKNNNQDRQMFRILKTKYLQREYKKIIE